MTKILEILISPDGKISLQTKGFQGASCREASKFIEQSLGQRLAERCTAEFHQVQAAEPIQQRHGS